jgi:hypothetical protein
MKNLASTKIKAENDLSLETQRMRKGLFPYLKDAKK